MKKFILFWALIVLACLAFGLGIYFLVDCLAMKHCSLPPLCKVHVLFFVFTGLSCYLIVKAKKQLRKVKRITRKEFWIIFISWVLSIPIVLWAFGPLVRSAQENPDLIYTVMGFGGLCLFFLSLYYFTKFLGKMGK